MVNLNKVGWKVCLTWFEWMHCNAGFWRRSNPWLHLKHWKPLWTISSGAGLLDCCCRNNSFDLTFCIFVWNVQNYGIFSVLPHSYRGVISSVFWNALHILLDNLVLESFTILPSCSLQQKYIMWFWEIYFVIKTNTFLKFGEIHFRVCNYFWKILESFIIPPSCSLQRKFSNE